MSFDGMNVEAVRRIGGDLAKQATALGNIRAAVDRLVDSSQQNWGGKDARDFAGWWRNQHRPQLSGLAEALRGLATSAKNNVAEQERASDSPGGAERSSDGAYPSPAEQSRTWLGRLPRTDEKWQDSLSRANVHYGDFSQDLSRFFHSVGALESSGEWRNNCGYASVAYEMRRRGYDVVANADLDGDTTGALASAYRDPQTGEAGTWMPTSGRDGTISAMEASGPGSRAIVFVRWQGNTGGHFFSVENMDGRIVFLDAQSNKTDVGSYFDRVEPGTVHILRTDNLEPNMNPMSFTMVTPNDK